MPAQCAGFIPMIVDAQIAADSALCLFSPTGLSTVLLSWVYLEAVLVLSSMLGIYSVSITIMYYVHSVLVERCLPVCPNRRF